MPRGLVPAGLVTLGATLGAVLGPSGDARVGLLGVSGLLQDQVARLTPQRAPASTVLLVNIDTESLESFPRPMAMYSPLMAVCIENLAKAGAERIAVDLAWQFDPSGFQRETAGAAALDPRAIEVLNDQVDLAAQVFTKLTVVAEKPIALAFAETLAEGSVRRPPRAWVTSPESVAYANLPVDADGVVRRYYYSTADGLSLAAALLPPGTSRPEVAWLPPRLAVPRQLSFRDCVAGRVPADLPKAVLIGACAPQLFDLRRVSQGDVCGGLVHLTAAEAALRSGLPQAASMLAIWLACALAAASVTLGHWLRPGVGSAAGLAVAGAAAVFVLPALLGRGLLVPAGSIGLATTVAVAGCLAAQVGGAGRERRRLSKALGTYLPRPALKRILERLDANILEGESVEVVVLFTDVAHYTSISELLTPAGVIALLNRHFTGLTDVAAAHGAWIEGYVGDLLVVYWPVGIDDQIPSARVAAERASNTARLMLAEREKLVAELDQVLVPQHVRSDRKETLARVRELFDYGVGVHRGPAVLGDLGSRHLRKFGVIGDTMNAASRVEGLTRKLGSRLLFSELAIEPLDRQRYRRLFAVGLAGRAAPLVLFEDRALTPRPEGFERAVAHWEQREWSEFDALLAQSPVLKEDPAVVRLSSARETAPVLRFDQK